MKDHQCVENPAESMGMMHSVTMKFSHHVHTEQKVRSDHEVCEHGKASLPTQLQLNCKSLHTQQRVLSCHCEMNYRSFGTHPKFT